MQDVAPGEEEINFADHGIALTRRFRALKIWLSMKVLGVGWFRGLVEHCCRAGRICPEALLEETGELRDSQPTATEHRLFSIRAGVAKMRTSIA